MYRDISLSYRPALIETVISDAAVRLPLTSSGKNITAVQQECVCVLDCVCVIYSVFTCTTSEVYSYVFVYMMRTQLSASGTSASCQSAGGR